MKNVIFNEKQFLNLFIDLSLFINKYVSQFVLTRDCQNTSI